MMKSSGLALALGVFATAAAAQSATSPSASSTPVSPPASQSQPAPPPAPGAMDRQALEAEVTASRPLVRFGGVQPNRPTGCTNAESRQFDFWLGEWDVYPTGQSFVIGENTITLHAQGCVVMEYWRPFQGGAGLSLNSFDPQDSMWHQEYVGAGGFRTPYSGTFEDGVMRLENRNPPPANSPPGFRRRMNFQQIDANTVRQWGEAFRDGQWTVAWDLTYRRRAGTRAGQP